MFLNAVVLVLQEILEAALLISVMLVFTFLLKEKFTDNSKLRLSWVFHSLWIGILGAWIYAANMTEVSEWFDYVGQEVLNASIHVLIMLLIIYFVFTLPTTKIKKTLFSYTYIELCMISIVALAIIREGSEIIIFITGIMSLPQNSNSVLLACFIGGGIGISSGVLLFYGLTNFQQRWALRISMILFAMVSGNMAGQAILLFTQADWLPFTSVLWDSSSLIPENRVVGQLLYALIGYEATPSILQASCYLIGLVVILISPLNRKVWQAEA